MLLWFATDDFDAAYEHAQALGAGILHGPVVNPNALRWESWIRDPDGSVVAIAGPQRGAA